MDYSFKSSMLNGQSGDIALAVKRLIVRAVNHKLYVTSTRRRPRFNGDKSYHIQGRAVDVAAKTREPMVAFQKFLVDRFGCSAFLELFGPDNGLNCKNGKPVTLDEGAALENQHDNHVHVVPSRLLPLPVPPAIRAAAVKARSVAAARLAGARYASQIYDAALKADLSYPLALGLVEKESQFRNQFGHDRDSSGRIIWHGTPGYVGVTRSRVKEYLSYAARTGKRQGVGLTQLTSGGFQAAAEAAGGLHKTKVQLDIGFGLLSGLIKKYGTRRGLGAYNGGPGNPQYAYADDVLKRDKRFREKGVK